MVCCASCARAPVLAPSSAQMRPALPVSTPPLRQDTVHIVAPGETLWRLGKMYDVPIETILRANGLGGPQDLKMGVRLRIPGAAPIRPVIPLYKSSRWKYIIIHHSATDEGNAYTLFNLHNRRGFAGLGYDFIIDNGTSGKEDGQIEVSPRWIKQIDGAHCKAGGMNHQGIGICLVGNFSRERVSEKQLESLVYLINILRDYYRIPAGKVMGHGQVPGAHTECPGTLFPWGDFRRRLQ